MQKPKVRDGFILLPVPAEVAEELELDPFTTIQYTISSATSAGTGRRMNPSLTFGFCMLHAPSEFDLH